MTSDHSGGAVQRQFFDPWGTVRSGSTPGVTPNFTGQRRDDTGLLFYNARYYDPAIGRFLSADWIVPGAGALTLHPFGPVASGAWGAGGGGPANPQDLNRYAYALNNPVGNSDPTGHCILGIVVDTMVCAAIGAAVVGMVAYAAVESARQLAEQYPVNACQYMTCPPSDSGNDGTKPALPSSDQGGQPASPTPPSNDPQSEYERTTRGRSVENRRTDSTRGEFEQNLRENGWKETKSADGKVTILEKDGARYVVRDNAKSTGGPTADYYPAGSADPTLKIRLGGP